jgi:hypothetical protein
MYIATVRFWEDLFSLGGEEFRSSRCFTSDSKNMFKFNEIWSLCPEVIAI